VKNNGGMLSIPSSAVPVFCSDCGVFSYGDLTNAYADWLVTPIFVGGESWIYTNGHDDKT